MPRPPSLASSRDLSAVADLSLGMTNAVLKKPVTKGLLVMKRVNSRNIHYALTADGLTEVARRSHALLKRTLKNVAEYRDAAESYVSALKKEGYQAIHLKNSSDLDIQKANAVAERTGARVTTDMLDLANIYIASVLTPRPLLNIIQEIQMTINL
ncbi:MAG: hypothetical protein DRZ90_17115 [Spirochaetes bacterium]|nr:MAG: hypothetical protein DRZ90_17115 [Spirochaetota bacterium]